MHTRQAVDGILGHAEQVLAVPYQCAQARSRKCATASVGVLLAFCICARALSRKCTTGAGNVAGRHAPQRC